MKVWIDKDGDVVWNETGVHYSSKFLNCTTWTDYLICNGKWMVLE